MNIEKKYNIQAKKSLGQNFLIDETILNAIASSTPVQGENIIEVGPGYGALTQKVLKNLPKSFTLLELDIDMVHILKERMHDEDWLSYCNNLDIQHIDVLEFTQVPQDNYKVIANIPYYITSPILHHFLYTVGNTPVTMTILMQKDVADKILKQYHHKKPKSSVLSLFLAKKSYIRKICNVPAESFSPAPKVDSTVLEFTLHQEYKTYDDESFLTFIKQAFCEPRKKLISNLKKSQFDIEKISDFFETYQISQNSRPEDIGIEIYTKMSTEL